MLSTVHKSQVRGRHRLPAAHSYRHSKIYWLNNIALCLMMSGIVMAFAGRHGLH